MADHPRLLQIAICDGTIGVFGRDESPLDLLREGVAPEIGLFIGSEEYSSHSLLCGVGCSHVRRSLGDDLREMSWSVSQISDELAEDREMICQGFGDADSIGGGIVEGSLQGAEWACQATDSCTHTSELSNEALPLFAAHPALSVELVKDVS